jgi:hypothetical protein
MTAPIRGEGRTLFAGILLLLLGFFDMTYGMVLVVQDELLVSGPDEQVVLIGDVTTWGWVLLVLGVIQVITGFGLVAGRGWARVLGIVAASLAILGHLPVIAGPTPIWSLLVIAGCVWVIHGLVVYGEPA